MNSPDSQPSSQTNLATEQDRRHHARYTTQVQVEIHQEGNEVPMRISTTDLSRGGCYVQLLIPLSVGIRVQLTLWLNNYSIVIHGLVVTRHPQFGNGIMFVDFEGEAEHRLRQYLDAIVA
ncbi:MAG: PilZ domain-containing protein [Terriglobales bacterium]